MLAFHTEFCDYFEYLIFKYSVFQLVRELFKSNQTGYGVYHGYLDSENKRYFCYSLRTKKVSVSYGNSRLSQISNFKNRSSRLGLRVDQKEPKPVWSIQCVPRV